MLKIRYTKEIEKEIENSIDDLMEATTFMCNSSRPDAEDQFKLDRKKIAERIHVITGHLIETRISEIIFGTIMDVMQSEKQLEQINAVFDKSNKHAIKYLQEKIKAGLQDGSDKGNSKDSNNG